MKDLQPNKSDRLASSARLIGAIGSSYAPVFAPVAAELLANLIPNQRIDRVADQVQRLELEVKTLACEMSVVETNIHSVEGRALIEEGLVQTANETDAEMRKRICSVLARSLTESDIDFYRTKKLLRVLKELVYPEVIWLTYYSTLSQKPLSPESAKMKLPDKSDFENTHSNLLKGESFTLIGPQREMDKEALQRSYKNTLLRLDLTHEVEVDGQRAYRITELGYLLVRYILEPSPAS